MTVKNRIVPAILWLQLTLVGCGGEMVESIQPELGDVEETLDALVVPGPTDTQGPADTSDSSADALDAAQAGDSASAAGPILIEAEVTWSGWNEVIRAEPGTFGLATVAFKARATNPARSPVCTALRFRQPSTHTAHLPWSRPRVACRGSRPTTGHTRHIERGGHHHLRAIERRYRHQVEWQVG